MTAAANGSSILAPAIQDFTFTGCNLTGMLPTVLSQLASLKSIDLSNNSLSGTLPEEWGGAALLKVCS